MDFFNSSSGLWAFLGASAGILSLLVQIVPPTVHFFRHRAPDPPVDGNCPILSKILAEQRRTNDVLLAMTDGVLANADTNLMIARRLRDLSKDSPLRR